MFVHESLQHKYVYVFIGDVMALQTDYELDINMSKWKADVISKYGYYKSRRQHKFIKSTRHSKKNNDFIATLYRAKSEWEEVDIVKQRY